nr:immunoglobulin heavy chain junction region [Macaca mulatta]MOW87379.1 immunoglobulin heavy chain junction region [Macaca mulatta]MOW89661.1 immunoglobulin heavy chain junction region [Macaca mulatta]MOW89910.1 immunoglobulin heavy chain junction region [Macaca mulatta]MOW91727.1 immunoglobulin heavy chain junction region [Macaca mulatta]
CAYHLRRDYGFDSW